MTYKIKLHPQVVKFIGKLRLPVKERVTEKLQLLKEEPFHYLEHYSVQGVYKLRIGEYRLLLDVDFTRKIIFVRYMNLRGRVYKRFR